MRRCSSAVALACALLGSAGCLTFEKEALVFAFPPGGREVRGLLVYEGLAPSGAGRQDLARAKEELGKTFAAAEQFYLGSWALQASLKPGPDDGPLEREKKALLRRHLVVGGGGFFLNEGGRLCGYQTVTVRDRGRFVADLNGLISRAMTDHVKGGLGDPRQRADWEDEETLRLMERACAKRFEWVRVEPGRLSLTVPATPAAAARLKREFLGADELAGLRDAASARPGKKGTDEPPREPTLAEVMAAVRSYCTGRQLLIELVSDFPLSFDQRKDRITVSLGLGDGEPILGGSTGAGPALAAGEADLIAHARTLNVPFKSGVTAEKLIADFLQEHTAGKKP
jgi:hypothetical protein